MLLPVLAFALWDAWVLTPDGQRVDFQLELSNGPRAALLNGRDRIPSSGGSSNGGKLRLEFKDWDAVLEAQVSQNAIDGAFTRTWRKTKLVREFHARRPTPKPAASTGGDISGAWLFEFDDGKARSEWRGQFEQKGNDATGVLIPVSGDTGELTGRMENGKLRLGRFDGIRTLLLNVSLTAQGTLEGTFQFAPTIYKVTARRAGATGGPDALGYTSMKNPTEPFRFDFPDLDGKAVSSMDARFQGKVLIVTITGSWCPNCHEEAPLLNEFYERYKARGLEIVALGFEYTGDVDRDRRQLKLFADKHGIRYPILLAGTTEDASEKLAQLENFGAYPTTIFIGRDGLVKSIHAGYDGPSTGARHTAMKHEMTKLVEELLAAR